MYLYLYLCVFDVGPMFVFQTGLEQIWPRVPIHSRSICQSEAAAEISMNIFQMQEKKCKRDILRICKEAKKNVRSFTRGG